MTALGDFRSNMGKGSPERSPSMRSGTPWGAASEPAAASPGVRGTVAGVTAAIIVGAAAETNGKAAANTTLGAAIEAAANTTIGAAIEADGAGPTPRNVVAGNASEAWYSPETAKGHYQHDSALKDSERKWQSKVKHDECPGKTLIGANSRIDSFLRRDAETHKATRDRAVSVMTAHAVLHAFAYFAGVIGRCVLRFRPGGARGRLTRLSNYFEIMRALWSDGMHIRVLSAQMPVKRGRYSRMRGV